MNAKKQGRSLKAELYEQYEELLFRIALLEMNEDEADQLEQGHGSDPEMDRFFTRTQARTLKIIEQAARKKKVRHAIRAGLPRVMQIAAAVLLVFFIGATVAIASVPALSPYVEAQEGGIFSEKVGKVRSKSSSTNQYGKLTGYLESHGSVFTVNRDSASVAAGKSSSMYWSNPNNEAGKYSVALASPGGHDGTGSASSPCPILWRDVSTMVTMFSLP